MGTPGTLIARRRRRTPLLLATVIAFGATAAGALAASTNFVEPATSPEAAGDGPAAVVAANLDGDSDVDLATANQNSGDVTILKNGGTGNLNQPPSSPEAAGSLPDGIVAGDFDGDADTDLAVSNFATDDVTILLNTGSGNFVQPATSPEPAGDAPDELVAADLDGDGDPDLATANSGTADVTILLATGGGDFTPRSTSPEPAGTDPRGIAAGDLDGDGDNDLAVANASDDQVTILRNGGTGNFNPPPSSPEAAGDFPQSIVAVDLDGDGDRDLATANDFSDDVTILRNGGGSNFVEAASSPEPAVNRPTAIAAADFDLDGDADLAVTGFTVDQVAILRNIGTATGNFNQPASSPESTGDAPFGVAPADLDGDGDADLATSNIGSDDVTVLRNG